MKSLFKEILSFPYLRYRPKEKRKLVKNIKIEIICAPSLLFLERMKCIVLRLYRIDNDSQLLFNFSFL